MSRNINLLPFAIIFGIIGAALYMGLEVVITSRMYSTSLAETLGYMLVPDPTIILVRGFFGGIWGMILGASLATSVSGKARESGAIAFFGGTVLLVIVLGWARLFLWPYAGTATAKHAFLAFVYVSGPVAMLVLYGATRTLLNSFQKPVPSHQEARPSAEPISSAGQ